MQLRILRKSYDVGNGMSQSIDVLQYKEDLNDGFCGFLADWKDVPIIEKTDVEVE